MSLQLSNDSREIYLMVTPYFPRPDNPWTCAFTFDMAQAIERSSKYRVVIINPNHKGSYHFRGFDVIGFKEFASGRWVAPRLINALNCRLLWRALNDYGCDLKKIKYIHGHLVVSACYVKYLKHHLSGTKAMLQFHDSDPYGMMLGNGSRSRLKRRRYFKYHRNLIHDMDALISISGNVTKVLQEAPHQTVFNTYEPMSCAMKDLADIGRIPNLPRVILLHNGVNTAIFNADGKITTTSFKIGCVGIFRDLKSQITLLAAAKQLQGQYPSLSLQFIGIGPELNACQQYAIENGISATFIPSLEHSKLADFYRSLDLFVLPSYFEGFGCVLTESWSCGTPFITCEGQGIEDMILPEERQLWLCKQRDPQDLAAKIAYYFEHRPIQHMAAETDIDQLIPTFLDEVEAL